MLSRLLIIALLWSTAVYAEQAVLEVIPLKYRSVEEVLPVLQPFVGKEGVLSGMNSQLIVRTTPAKMAEIRKILARIDTLPRQLRIVVRQGGRIDKQDHGAEVSGQVGTGDVHVTVPARGGRDTSAEVDGARARIWRSDDAKQDEDMQEIQVLEGRQAFIRLGLAVPLKETTVVHGGVTSHVVESTRYEEIGTGFYVVPRLNGDQVVLDISPQKERLIGSRGQNIEIQRLVTTVSGRLGEWIELGGLSQQQEDSETGWVYGTGKMSSDTRRVWVKVEERP